MDDNKYGYPYGGSPFAPRGSGGYPQPFGQPPRPAYPPQPRPAADTLLDGTQILTGEGFKPLSRKEREEAARIAAEAGFSFEGYQVVRREFFSHKFDPTLTIRSNGITFNNACISRLDEVVYVQVLINPDTVALTVKLLKKDGRSWTRIKSWSDSGSGNIDFSLSRSYTGSRASPTQRRIPENRIY